MTCSGEENKLSRKCGDICNIIGRGSSALILLSRKQQEWNPNVHSFYAIKVFCCRPGIGEAAFRKKVNTEFAISSSLCHRNIVQVFELIEVYGDYICQCLEYCPGGDLHSLVAESGRLDPEEADCLLKQLTRGVNYLHREGIAHRDLKPENLLLTLDGGLKIADFGTAESFAPDRESDIHVSTTRRGSTPYLSPEQFLSGSFDPMLADIWAVAVTYIVIRTGRIPCKVATSEDENFRDYISDCQIGKGYFLIDDICVVSSDSLLMWLKQLLISSR